MAIYAVVQSGVVENLVEWNGDTSVWSPPDGTTTVLVQSTARVSVGWTYANDTFSPPT